MKYRTFLNQRRKIESECTVPAKTMTNLPERIAAFFLGVVILMIISQRVAYSQAEEAAGMAKYRGYVERALTREINRARTSELARLRANGQTAAALSAAPVIEPATFEEMVLQPHSERHVLVRFNSAAAPTNALATLGYVHENSLPLVPGLRRLLVPAGITMQDALEQLNALDAVAYAEPDYKTLPLAVPNDPRVEGTNAWWLHAIRAYSAWDVATDASAIGPVAVFDSGVDVAHEDLSANLWVNTDEVPGDGIDNDGNGYVDDVNGITTPHDSVNTKAHGTKVSGTICGRGNNGIGSAGSTWGCQLMDIHFARRSGNTIARVVEGFAYAVAEGSRISNHSWRVFFYSQALADAVTEVQQSGHLLIAAAGNSNNDIDAENLNYPARLPNDNVITIAGSTEGDSRVYYSSYGPVSVDLAAPTGFVTTHTYDRYGGFSGTSQAAPVVTGAVALAWAQRPSWTYLQIRQHLLENVRPETSWSGLTVTGGLLDMQAMMESLKPCAYQSPPQCSGQSLPDRIQLKWCGTEGLTTYVLRNRNYVETVDGAQFDVFDHSAGDKYAVRWYNSNGEQEIDCPLDIDASCHFTVSAGSAYLRWTGEGDASEVSIFRNNGFLDRTENRSSYEASNHSPNDDYTVRWYSDGQKIDTPCVQQH